MLKMLKDVMIPVFCAVFVMSSACSGESTKNGNLPKNNVQNNVNNHEMDVGGKSDANNNVDTSESKDTNEHVDTDADFGDSSDEDPKELITPEQFIAQAQASRAASVCSSVFRCPEKIERYWNSTFGRTGDEAMCIEKSSYIFQHRGGWDTEEILASVATGRTTFDAAKAAACLEAEALAGAPDP